MADIPNSETLNLRPFEQPFPAGAKPWQVQPATQLLAAIAAIAPMAVMSVWMHLLRESAITINDLLLWPLMGGGSLIFWILFLHLLVCGDGLAALGFRIGRAWQEILIGVGLSVALLAFNMGFNATVARLFPRQPPSEAIIELMTGLARNPRLLVVWLGPVVWIGVALFEELMRAFLLCRLWRVWRDPLGRWMVVLFVSTLIGLAHGYQGPAAMLSIGIQSLFMGWFFMATGRIRALIVAHALYDSIQIILAVIALRQMGS